MLRTRLPDVTLVLAFMVLWARAMWLTATISSRFTDFATLELLLQLHLHTNIFELEDWGLSSTMHEAQHASRALFTPQAWVLVMSQSKKGRRLLELLATHCWTVFIEFGRQSWKHVFESYIWEFCDLRKKTKPLRVMSVLFWFRMRGKFCNSREVVWPKLAM